MRSPTAKALPTTSTITRKKKKTKKQSLPWIFDAAELNSQLLVTKAGESRRLEWEEEG
jgi:hypothetical protein